MVVMQKPLHLQQRNKITLAKNSTIRHILALLFLVLFAYGITPKITLHNLVASHRDGRTKSTLTDTHATQLSKAGFNCQCDNLIIESPFVAEAEPLVVIPQVYYPVFCGEFVADVYTSTVLSYSLRGPPAC